MSRRAALILIAAGLSCCLAATASATASAKPSRGGQQADGAAVCPSSTVRQDRSPRQLRCVVITRARLALVGRPHRRRRAPLAVAASSRTSAKAASSRLRASAARSVSGGLVVGLDADTAGWGGDSTAGRIDQVSSDTGAKWMREVFTWSTIEPTPGHFDFSYYDHYMLLAAQRGVHILALLHDTPAWAGATSETIPSDPTAFAQYVAAVVGRYGANGSFWTEHPSLRSSAITTWEIWNEPYLPSGNNNDYNPGRYAQLVKAAAIAGRSADPNAKFIMAAEMQSSRDANGNWQWWTDALYQAVPDLNNYFDGVAVHDYGNDTTRLNPMIAGQAYNNYGHIRRIENLRQQFLAHGANKPFWITEAGWSTCTDATNCVTPAQQATNLAALFALIHGSWSSWVQGAFIYRYGDGANPSTSEDAYGLTNLDGTPKPALAIFKAQALLSAN